MSKQSSMSSKQSSVQWLFQQLWDTPKDKFEWRCIFLMAHEMHQKEIQDAYDHHRCIGNFENGEQYFKQTFGGQDNQ